MNLGRSVFAQLISFLPDREFRRCVSRYDGDRGWRGFSCWDQFLSMAFAQLTYRESLRDIEACLRSLSAKLYHMGFRSQVARSTLADANESRDWRIYADFAQVLIGIARPLYARDPIGLDLDDTQFCETAKQDGFGLVSAPKPAPGKASRAPDSRTPPKTRVEYRFDSGNPNIFVGKIQDISSFQSAMIEQYGGRISMAGLGRGFSECLERPLQAGTGLSRRDAPCSVGVRVAMERKPGVFGDHAVSVRDSSRGVDASHALPGRARR